MANQQKKQITQASDQELRDFAELVLQLPVPEGAKRPALMALIGPAWPAEYIFVDAAEVAEPEMEQSDEVRAQAAIKIGGSKYQNDPKWLIKISATELPGGKDPVPVSVNGTSVVIQRGQEVECPHRYIEALRNAVRVSISQDQKTQEFTSTTFTNYPMEVLERPSRGAIEEFLERTKDSVLA